LPSDAIDVLVGKTLDALRRNIINPLCDLLGNQAEYYPGKRELHIFNNIVYTVGANDERAEGKIRGSSIRKALGDELTLWPESFFKMLDSRLSFDESEFFGATNPDNPNHWLKRDYLDRAKDLDIFIGHFRIKDNPYLSSKYVEAISRNYVGLWYKRFILGLWVAAEGAIYDFFDEDEHTRVTFPEALYYDVGVDYGTGNPTAFLLFGNNPMTKPKIWTEEEYYYDGRTSQAQKTDKQYSDDLQSFLKERLGLHWRTKVRKIYLDPSAESFQVQLRQDGIGNVVHADNSVLDGIRTVARMLRSGEFAIGVKCKHLIAEMFGYVWDRLAQARGEDKPKKESDHCEDAMRYVVHSKFGQARVDLAKLTQK
jgi:PBSX family phage terminase large subunit